ncbi:MAG: phosphoribosylanthranilate isomerase [Planctomycetota bacterium]
MARTRIKICGIRDAKMAEVAADAGADAIGLVFHTPSPRYVEPARAAEILAALPPWTVAVGLHVDPTLDDFLDIEETCPAPYTQLHGDEPEGLVRRIGPDVIKYVRYDEATIDADLKRWGGVDEVCAILVDGSAGGDGVAFDWQQAARPLSMSKKRIILAGGLTPGNVGEAIRAVRPWAVDVSSGVESSRGVKDAGLVRAFCAAVHASA